MIYDKFQKEAIDYISQNYSVIVSAPTGAGKTAIAEHVIYESLKKNVGVIYTAPIKALSNQKYRDFQEKFKDVIGILTGDVSINPEAPVLIMTTEIFRNKIFDDPESLNKYSWVIYDEIHYIDNPERGTVWEESLIFLPKHINILALSATIPNIKQFADWIVSIHKKEIKTVIEENRPVPLHFFFQSNNEVSDNLRAVRKSHFPKANRLNSLIKLIENKKALPAIYFVFGRRRAEELAFELNHDFLTENERFTIAELWKSLIERFDLKEEKSAARLFPLVEKGVAFHHAGMLPTLKEVVERLFTSRLLKVIFTTETFALGINMPSRSVIFDELRKFYGHFVRNLKTRDFYQMAGRAGRRGMDKEGFVYCRINPSRINPDQVARIIYGKPEEVRSQLNSSYATVLNLYEKHAEELIKIYPDSLHFYQSRKNEQKEAVRLIEARINLLKELGHIKNGELTQKGLFAKNVYGYELILSELFEKCLLEQFSELDLAIMSIAIVFEPRKNQKAPVLATKTKKLKNIIQDLYGYIKDKELKYRVYPVSKQPFFHLSAAIETWLKGKSFPEILQFTDTDEGEVVRYFRMGIQILKEVKDARVSSFLLRDKINKVLRLINRDVVDAEKQLREG